MHSKEWISRNSSSLLEPTYPRLFCSCMRTCAIGDSKIVCVDNYFKGSSVARFDIVILLIGICPCCERLYLIRGEARALFGRVYIHIFVFCSTNFFNFLKSTLFQKKLLKLVGQSLNMNGLSSMKKGQQVARILAR